MHSKKPDFGALHLFASITLKSTQPAKLSRFPRIHFHVSCEGSSNQDCTAIYKTCLQNQRGLLHPALLTFSDRVQDRAASRLYKGASLYNRSLSDIGQPTGSDKISIPLHTLQQDFRLLKRSDGATSSRFNVSSTWQGQKIRLAKQDSRNRHLARMWQNAATGHDSSKKLNDMLSRGL